MPSWITSVYALSGRKGPSSSSASTALAMLPTPDRTGSRAGGRRPWLTSWPRNSSTWPAICFETLSGGLNGALRSGSCVGASHRIGLVRHPQIDPVDRCQEAVQLRNGGGRWSRRDQHKRGG